MWSQPRCCVEVKIHWYAFWPFYLFHFKEKHKNMNIKAPHFWILSKPSQWAAYQSNHFKYSHMGAAPKAQGFIFDFKASWKWESKRSWGQLIPFRLEDGMITGLLMKEIIFRSLGKSNILQGNNRTGRKETPGVNVRTSTHIRRVSFTLLQYLSQEENTYTSVTKTDIL